MNKGIVMQISGGNAIVMENGGAFNKVRCQPGWQVGQVVSLEARRTAALQKKLLVAAACLVFVVSSAFASYHFLFSTVSYVSMDINPGISIGLNRLNRVVSATGHNGDGAEALAQLDMKWKTHTDALGTLVESEAMLPYLEDGEYLVFTVYSRLKNCTLDMAMEPLLEAVQTKYNNLEVGLFWVDQETFRQAQSEQISPAKLLLARRLSEAGGQLAGDEVANLSIAQLCGQLYAKGGHMELELGQPTAPGGQSGTTGGNSSPGGSGPGSNNGNNSGGNDPGSNNGNNSGGNDPGSNNGNNSGGNDPSSNNGNNSGGNDPGSNNGNNSGGNDPGSNNGNNSGGNDPSSNNGNNSGGNDPGSNNGNNSGGNDPSSNNGNNSGGNDPSSNNGNNSGGKDPNSNNGNSKGNSGKGNGNSSNNG